jgi:hypothetical protein
MKISISCPSCNGTGSANDSQVFFNETEIPEVDENCRVCKGSGYIEEGSPEGVRIAMLVSKKIVMQYPGYKNWELVYPEISSNIVNAVNHFMSEQNVKQLIFDGEEVFSEDNLSIDKIFENWIIRGNYVEEAKNILGIH